MNLSFSYLIKIPPTYIRTLQELFAIEELQFDEKTKFRDALELQVEDKLVSFQRYKLEINQLKRRRDNLSSREEDDKGIKQILELKEEAEESLKIAQNEIGIIRERALEAKATMVKFGKKNDDAMQQIEQLQYQ
ncbi:hypothetical protein ABFS83_01G024500 [Erythranthe nasuta]